MKNIKRTFAFMAVFLLLIDFSMAQTQNSSELKKINLARFGDKLEAQIELDRLFKYESFPLLNPNRLVIDFPQVTKFSCDPYIKVNDFGVKTIRTANFKPDVVRVVFDLAEKPPSYTIKENERGLTVVFWFEEEKEKKPTEIKEKPVRKERKTEEAEKKEREKATEITFPKLYEETTISIGFNSGFHAMHSLDFQNVYGKNIFCFGGDITVMISPRTKEYIGVSLGSKYISSNGISNEDERVELRIIPIFLSVLYVRKFRTFSPYIGAGLDYYDYKERFPEASGIPSISSYPWGTHVQVGTYIKFISSLSLKLYFKYHSARVKENELDKNLGGNEYGLAIAFHFKI